MRRPALIVILTTLIMGMPLQRSDPAGAPRNLARTPQSAAGARFPDHTLLNSASLPLSFEPLPASKGRTGGFLARTAACAWVITPESLVIHGRAQEIRMRFSGAAGQAKLAGVDALARKSNYLTGRDPSGWRTGVTNFARVKASGLYQGIEIQYYGAGRNLEFDILAAPHADLSAVRLAFEGAEALGLDHEGGLVLRSGSGTTVLRKPRAFQMIERGPREVPIDYALGPDDSVRLVAGRYDRALPLAVDPVISFSSHLGGGGDLGRAVAVDDFGNIYLAGETPSIQFPTRNPLQPTFGGQVDAFVTKISSDGSGPVYATYLGGSGEDRAQAIVVDSDGNTYITGSTRSADFPVLKAVQSRLSGSVFGDAFITKLSADGSALVYSTYLGGDDDDSGNGIVVDASGSAIMVGTTRSTNFPTRLPLQFASGGLADIVVARLSTDGGRLLFSTYLGGSDADNGRGIALDGAGNVYITGATSSADFPLRNALQRTLSGATSPFVAKLDVRGGGIVYSTYLGGGEGNAIAADRFGYVHITGQTGSATFPTVNAAQSLYGGGLSDVFVSKIDPAGANLLYSTFLGGQGAEKGSSIAVDSAGCAYIGGYTSSYNFPAKNPLQSNLRGVDDAFVAELDSSGSSLLFSTIFGGSGSDQAFGLAVDRAGNICLTGRTYSLDLPATNAFKPNLTGFFDAFVVKVAPDRPLNEFVYFPQVTLGGGYSTVFTLTNSGAAAAAATLTLSDRSGKPWTAVVKATGQPASQGTSFQITVAAGASAILSATPVNTAGALQTGWAFLETTGGRMAGAATFRRTDGSMLKSIAGLPASQPLEYADIPVNNDESHQRFTGFALANPGDDPVIVKIVTMDANGKVVDNITPAELNPLVGRGQTARFLHELIPARAHFSGSMILLPQGGKRIVVVALVQDRGQITVIPVIPAKPPGI